MRVFAAAVVLVLSSGLMPSFAQNEEKAPAASESTSTPVQPELTPQQSDKAKEQNRQRAEDTKIDRDWRAHRDANTERMGRDDTERMRDMDRDHRTMGRNWRMHSDDDRGRADRKEGYGRDYYDEERHYDEERPQRRVKICLEYRNGDEYCHYR